MAALLEEEKDFIPFHSHFFLIPTVNCGGQRSHDYGTIHLTLCGCGRRERRVSQQIRASTIKWALGRKTLEIKIIDFF